MVILIENYHQLYTPSRTTRGHTSAMCYYLKGAPRPVGCISWRDDVVELGRKFLKALLLPI